MNTLFVFIQHLLPHHALSRLVGFLARCKIGPVKDALIKLFCKAFKVDMQDCVRQRPDEFEHFNDFFTRELKPDARSWEEGAPSPVDGTVSQMGDIRQGRLIQAKGRDYRVDDLVADPQLAARLDGGQFATLYLSPKDYHRIHMPFDGTLKKMIHVPGRLFSVNKATAEGVPNLFARNERAVCVFDTPHGEQVLVLVGAMIVASISTAWHGQVSPVRNVQTWDYRETREIKLSRGDELGQFYLGSTVIWLSEADRLSWGDLEPGDGIKLGQKLGSWL